MIAPCPFLITRCHTRELLSSPQDMERRKLSCVREIDVRCLFFSGRKKNFFVFSLKVAIRNEGGEIVGGEREKILFLFSRVLGIGARVLFLLVCAILGYFLSLG